MAIGLTPMRAVGLAHVFKGIACVSRYPAAMLDESDNTVLRG
ncbi:MAG: hypothetical protein WCI09_05945 [Planctomycetota bacterium]